jgi:hypothetical protein
VPRASLWAPSSPMSVVGPAGWTLETLAQRPRKGVGEKEVDSDKDGGGGASGLAPASVGEATLPKSLEPPATLPPGRRGHASLAEAMLQLEAAQG